MMAHQHLSSRRVLHVSLCTAVLSSTLAAGDSSVCPTAPPPDVLLVTDADFSFSIESASGRAGEVVGVKVFLRSGLVSPNGLFLTMASCHDPQVAEIVGSAIYTDELLDGLGVSGGRFTVVDETANPLRDRGHGFVAYFGLWGPAYSARFPSDTPWQMMTVYYRLKGAPGATGALTFCDGMLERDPVSCHDNHAYSWLRLPNDGGYLQYEYRSESNEGGVLGVLEGEPVNTERPPDPHPPVAKRYPGPLTPEEVDFRVRIAGARAAPGATEVPVEVYISAAVEYSAVEVPIDFDERSLRLARAEEYFIGGQVMIENREDAWPLIAEEGVGILYTGAGIDGRRLAREGEEVLAATLYFDVLEAAAEIESTRFEVRTVAGQVPVNYPPFIAVHDASGGSEAVASHVEPFEIANGILHIVGDVSYFVRGDANDDLTVDLADAAHTLNFLFLGGRAPRCFDAADANDDGKLEIVDPVRTLNRLFLGADPLPPPNGVPGEDPTADTMTCSTRG
jgi:hypothetical protein